jgi:carboxymethylenebutenolidase
MTAHVDYYFSLTSPWSYLGHERFLKIASNAGATVTPYEVSYRGTIFAATGGLPVHKRSAQRQAYRLQELARWRDHLGIHLNVHPKHWPNDETVAASMVIALRETESTEAALKFSGQVMKGVWSDDRDISDTGTLVSMANETGFDGEHLLAVAADPKWAELRQSQTDAAIEKGVFGAPSYCVEDQVYWGQDRLDFVQRHLDRIG